VPIPAAVLLMGPTGAGKSDLALELVQKFPFEIVSVDSALVYRGMDIGTAKPSPEILASYIHHLINIRDPLNAYSVGEFVRDAAVAMRATWGRQRIPLLVGGTMLYYHALSSGLAELPAANIGLRAAIDAEAKARGWGDLHRELASVDPAAAQKIHPNDPQRIQRALEVYRGTGETLSSLQGARTPILGAVRVLELAIAPTERSSLHQRIEKRFDAMLQSGFLEEVKALYSRGDLTATHASMRAVGYRQLWRHLAGEWSLQEARLRAVVATRQLAKRQLTWLKARPNAQWLEASATLASARVQAWIDV
jgi:tRNA dimethylallyltransferase